MIHASISWQSKFSKKCYLLWFPSLYILIILSHHQMNLISSIKVSIENKALIDDSSTQNSVFFSRISTLIVQNFRRKRFNFIFSRYSNSFLTKTTAFISSIKVGIKKTLFVEGFSIENLSVYAVIGVLTANFWRSAIFFKFAPFSNLYSSATTNSNYSIMCSV